MSPMNVLSVAPEIFPLIKTGGLADVAGALPVALAGKGVAVRTLVPGYPAVMRAFRRKKPVLHYASLQGGKAAVHSASLSGLDLLVLDAPHLFDRMGGPYGDVGGKDWPDNWRRFAALGQVGADIAAGAVPDYEPDIVHAHDWQAAMTLAYMRYGKAVGTPSVITVHNLAFQGQFGADIFAGLGLPARRWRWTASSITAAWASSRPACRRPGRSPPSAPPMRRKSARRNSAWAWTACSTCARPTSTASSTASTPMSGTRPRTNS